MIRRSLTLGVLALAACGGGTGLGDPCTLVKHNPAGGNALPITEGELPLVPADYVTFASPSCLDVCVRDSAAQRTGDNAAPATGYCSQACAGAGAACPDPSFTCRPLLLDEATLAALCSTDSATCQAFPEGPKTFFCVKGGR